MFRGVGKLIQRLNNVKVSRKLLLIYFCCVLLPIVVTNILFAVRISDSVKKEQLTQADNTIESIKKDIKKEFENVIYLSTTFYTDRVLNETLERQYPDEDEYFKVYSTYLSDYIKRNLPIYKQVNRISIYTDNTSILLNGELVRVEKDLEKHLWVKGLERRNSPAYIFPYYEEGRMNLSVIRSLDYFYLNNYKKILKVDISITALSEYLNSGLGHGDVFLVDKQDRIVLSSNTAYTAVDLFKDFNAVNIKPDDKVVVREMGMNGVLEGWRVVGVFGSKELFNVLSVSTHFIIFTSLINLLVATMVIAIIAKSISKRLRTIVQHIKMLKSKNLETIECQEGSDEIGDVIREFNSMTRRIQEMIKNEYESNIEKKNLELERKQAMLNALQSQINPHFLFNTLECIRMRSSIKKEQETASIIKYLSKIFRQMITWGNDLIDVSQELDFVENYLKIQKYRFGDKISYEIIINPQAKNKKIPKMSIQPLLENACIHGLQGISQQGNVIVKVELVDGFLHCIVEDNGKGMDESKLEEVIENLKRDNDFGDSIGMKNVYNRLKLFYGNNFIFNIESSNYKGTKVFISIPADIDKGK